MIDFWTKIKNKKSRFHFDFRLTDFIKWLYISCYYILTLDHDNINWYCKQLLLFYIFVTLYEFKNCIKRQHFNFHYVRIVLYKTIIVPTSKKKMLVYFLLFSNGNGR